MRRGFIVTEDEEHGKRRIPIISSLIIGRAADCDVTLDDAAASRHHVEIQHRDNDFVWKDMGSTNGTVLNGAQMLEGVLQDGDVILIGETELRFEVEEVLTSVGSEESTLFRTLITADGETLAATHEEAHAEELLRAVYTVMNQIASNFDPCSLVDQVLETSMRAIDAQRGAILFAATDGEELLPCPICEKYHIVERGRLRHVTRENVRISNTVAHRVLNRGESVLYQDTHGEHELDKADSIISLNLASIMCVPLRGKYGILGLLYVDTNEPGRAYTREDMLLSTAVGNSAGLAIENAQMHNQMVEKERIEQEISHAAAIQEGFLVKDWPDSDPRFQVYGETRPARVVGGDFYDFVTLDADRVGLLIGDVSGKGVPAALTMAQILAQFRLAVRDSVAPHQVIAMLNNELIQRSSYGTFCTLCYVVLDLSTRQLLCANAGHYSVLCLSPSEAREFAPASGPPIGILSDGGWMTIEESLAPNETLLLYTDGIVEARGLHTRRDAARPSDEFGIRNLTRVAQGFSNDSPRDMIGGVLLSVLEYTAPTSPHDDCTLIGIRLGR